MKKFLIALFSFTAIFLFTTTGVFAEENSKSKVLLKIEQTNIKIEKEITEAQKKGLDLVAHLDEENAKLDAKLMKAQEKKLSSEELAMLESEITEKKALNKKKFDDDLNRLIEKLLNKTYEMTTKTIDKAAEEGVEAVCFFVEVRVGDQLVNVDPIQVVGF